MNRYTRNASVALTVLLATMAVNAQEEPGAERRPYTIGIEDRLAIKVWKQPEVSGSVTVRPDGKVTVPLVGDLIAEGRTPTKLADEVSVALARYIKDPVVTVTVEEINHFKVYVIGEVGSQGVLQLTRPTRLLQAIAQCGGLTAYADKSNVTVVRYQEGQEVRIRVDYRKVLSGQEPDMNLDLKPGDTIIVR